MKTFLRILVSLLVVIVLLAAGVFIARAVNGQRFPDPPGMSSDLADPAQFPTGDQGAYEVTKLDSPGVVGFHLEPKDPQFAGTVITFGGSEGGPDFSRAQAIAEAGHNVYALYFFGQPGLPEKLENVPLEFFGDYLDAENPDGPITVLGTSKGAELVFELARLYPEVTNVIAIAPTAYRWQGIGGGQATNPTWTWEGEASGSFISFRNASPSSAFDMVTAFLFNTPVEYGKTYASAAERGPNATYAKLDVTTPEHVALFAGTDDLMWPAADATHQIQQERPDADVHIYDGAGHVFGLPDAWASGMMLGGTEEANVAAAKDSIQAIQDNLAEWHGQQ